MRRSLRKTLFVVFLSLAIVFSAAYFISGFGVWGVTQYRRGVDHRTVVLRRGQFGYVWMKNGGSWDSTSAIGPSRMPGYSLGRALPHYVKRRASLWGFMAPLWIPAAICVIPAILLFAFGRSTAGGCRRCGYDQSGTLLPVCPECGEPITRP